MAPLFIESWSEDRRKAGKNSWPIKALCYRLNLCIPLADTDLKRVARGLLKKEIMELEGINVEAANPLIHTLESLGAKIVIK